MNRRQTSLRSADSTRNTCYSAAPPPFGAEASSRCAAARAAHIAAALQEQMMELVAVLKPTFIACSSRKWHLVLLFSQSLIIHHSLHKMRYSAAVPHTVNPLSTQLVTCSASARGVTESDRQMAPLLYQKDCHE